MSTSATTTRPRHVGGVSFAASTSNASAINNEEKLQRMMAVHKSLVETVQKRNQQLINPFARECEERLKENGGWESYGIQFDDDDNNNNNNNNNNNENSIQIPSVVSTTQKFLLPNSKTRFPVKVLDNVLSKDLCQSFIACHEEVGFRRPTSLLQMLAQQTDAEGDNEYFKKYAYEQAKNTSELVQIESQEFAGYLWKRLQHELPDHQDYVGQFTTGRYEKVGIIPVFRFMRYQKDQGFKPHKDPQRIHLTNPLDDDVKEDAGANYDDTPPPPGIYQSLFTISLYLNSPLEFVGGNLNFVRLIVKDQSQRTYESQATVEPAVGRCVLFAHDELHEGGGIQEGTKYMCQCDVLYKRVE